MPTRRRSDAGRRRFRTSSGSLASPSATVQDSLGRGAGIMKHICCLVGTLMVVSSCMSQREGAGTPLVEASKLVKISLVDAVQRANKVLDGQVVGAMLD